MTTQAAADPYRGRRMTAGQAVQAVRSGEHVVVGSGAAEPSLLVQALAQRREELADVEVLHLLTLGPAPYAEKPFEGHIRHNALFIGPNVRGAVTGGLADYTPCYLHEVPSMIRSGRLRVDAALIQVSPPQDGFCSLGVSVDILKAAVEKASYVAAQVNARMPATAGDTRLAVEDIDAFVLDDSPLFELARPEPTAASLWIGRYVSRLVEDGATLQAGIGAVPDAVVSALSGKKDLGVHTELVSDGILRLLEAGAATGRRKTLHPGKIVSGFALGSRRLYEAVASPEFEFYPVDYVNDPCVIGRNDRMTAINSALSVDLTGQVSADSVGPRFYSGVGGQVDFIRGAARSAGGRSIIVLPSTALRGAVSRVVSCLAPGAGVVTTRADVDFVVTEYGIASLKGKTIRQRALALIGLAHPAFRPGLAAQAKRLGYLDMSQLLPPDSGPYLVELECRRRFAGQELFLRPLKPTDERALKDLFYSQSRQTTLMRFGLPLKRLSERQFQELVCIDFRSSMALGAFLPGSARLVAVARYCADPGGKSAEAAVTVHDDLQGRGLGPFMLDYLSWIAHERGLETLRCEVQAVNMRMRRLLEKCFTRVEERGIGLDGVSLTVRLCDRRSRANPALPPPAA